MRASVWSAGILPADRRRPAGSGTSCQPAGRRRSAGETPALHTIAFSRWGFRAAALLAAGCAGSPAAPSPPRRVAEPEAAEVLGPARYLYTDRLGVVFDEAGRGAALPRAEPAIVDGVRVMVDGGVVVAAARHADRLSGLSSLPDRLGGGFVLWSEDRVYRAKSFLGDLVAIADVGATGGVRPWLGSFLLRTPSGLLDVDPRSLALHRVATPGIAEARAADTHRAARVDALGRAAFTTDGGATWTDLSASRGAVASSLREEQDGSLILTAEGTPTLVLDATGVHPSAPRVVEVEGRDPMRPATPLILPALPTTSRALPGELAAQAVAYGALLPGGRILVSREGGVRVLASSTGLPIDDADLLGVDDRFAHCQAVALDAPPRAALACTGETGALVLDLDASLTRPSLEAALPTPDAGFVAGPRGRLAFEGRCGRDAPGSLDLGPGTAKRIAGPDDDDTPDAAPSAPPGPPDPPPADDARVCVRVDASRWIERRLRGDDARRLYRWVPGDDGAVTALILGPPPESVEDAGPPLPPPDGVRVIHLDPDDPALHGGAFPTPRPPERAAPYRTVDTDFWQDDDGSIRGWIRLSAPPLPSQSRRDAGAPGGVSGTTPLRDGPWAGARIDTAGRVTLLPIPDATVEVVTGGRFALAMARGDGAETWFETLDGGASWAPVEGPPTGRINPPADQHVPFGCSAAGCSLGSGVVRLGWGGPAPGPRSGGDLALEPAVNRRLHDPDPIALTCHVDVALPAAAPAPHPPIALRLPGTTIGAIADHTWSGDVIPPFQPGAALRHLSVQDRALGAATGAVIPILGPGARTPLDLLLVVDRRRLRAGAAATLLPFDVPAKMTIAADAPGGDLVLLDAERGTVWVSHGDATSPAMQLTRVPDVSRRQLTLGRRLADGGLAVVAYSTSSGEVVAGSLELGRAEVGPLTALARLDRLGACAGETATHRVLLELPVKVRVTGRGKEVLFDEQVTAAVLVAAGPDRLCVEGVEAASPRWPSAVLSAVLGRGDRASVRIGGKSVRAACAMGRGR